MAALLEREDLAFLSDCVDEYEAGYGIEIGDEDLPTAVDCNGGCDGTCSGSCSSCTGTMQW